MEFIVRLIVILGLGFLLDLLASQMVVWSLSLYHVSSGIWPAFLLVVTLSFIVGLSAKGGSA